MGSDDSEDQSAEDQSDETQTVEFIGPTRFRYELTEEEVAQIEDSDYPLGEIAEAPIEWEPVGNGEWTVFTDRDEPDDDSTDS